MPTPMNPSVSLLLAALGGSAAGDSERMSGAAAAANDPPRNCRREIEFAVMVRYPNGRMERDRATLLNLCEKAADGKETGRMENPLAALQSMLRRRQRQFDQCVTRYGTRLAAFGLPRPVTKS